MKITVLKTLFVGMITTSTAYAAGDAAQANNPLANMTAFNMQNYYIGDVSGTDKEANQFWFRYATPFSLGESNWILRGSLPVNTYPSPPQAVIKQDWVI